MQLGALTGFTAAEARQWRRALRRARADGLAFQLQVVGLLDRKAVRRAIGLPGVTVQHVPGEYVDTGQDVTLISIAPANLPERRPFHMRRVRGRFTALARPRVPRAERSGRGRRGPRSRRARPSRRSRGSPARLDEPDPDRVTAPLGGALA
jgi:hypothetical protein